MERDLAGGECSYYACLPTKTLLRPVEALSAARLAPGAAEAISGELDEERVWWWRDQVTDGRDDSWHASWIADQKAELVRGEARVARPGVVSVGEPRARVRRARRRDRLDARDSADRRARRRPLLDEPGRRLGEARPGQPDRSGRRRRRRGARAVLRPHGLAGHARRAQRPPAAACGRGCRRAAEGAARGARGST